MNKQSERNAERKKEAAGWRSAPILTRKGSNEGGITAGTVFLMGLAIVLLVAVVILLLMPLAMAAADFGQFIGSITPAHTFLVVLVLIFLVPLAIVFSLSYRRLTGRERPRWIKVEAVCSDHQLLPVVNYTEEGEVHGWSYRLLCSFDIDGQTHRVTPHGHDGHHFKLFKSQDAAVNFLRDSIGPEGRCKLLVNAGNLQEARLAIAEE